jgi:capsular exopolysaccharide synthesis family protein
MESSPQPQQGPPEEQPINLRAYGEILLKRKWIVLLVWLFAVGVTAVVTLRQTKIYSATTSLIIESNAPQVLGEGVREVMDMGTGSYWYSKEFYETQYKVLKSRAIAQRVVDQLGLNRDPKFLGIEKLSPELQRKAMERMDAAAMLASRVIVTPVKDSRVVNVAIEDREAAYAAILANAVASAYMQANLERRVEGTKDAAVWLEDQLKDLKTKLAASELSLFNFRKNNDLVYTTLENKQTIASQKLLFINDTLTKVRTKKAEIEARVRNVKAVRDSGDLERMMSLGIVVASGFINQLKLNYVVVSNEVTDLRERYGPDHPKMASAEQKLAAAKQNLVKEVDAILNASIAEFDEASATEKNLQVMLEDVKQESLETNKKEMDYKKFAREEENNQRLFELVLKRTKELDLSSMLRVNNIRILDPAKIINAPIKPKVQTNLSLALVLGLIAGVGLAFFIEYQDRSIKGHADIEALGLSFLGIIPSIPAGNPTDPGSRDLYLHRQPKSTVAECCRTIRTNLLFLSPDKPIKRMVVTSAGPQEGKTTTLINIGVALAGGGSRVLLVDTDMRRPRLHKSFGVSNELGLSNLIVNEGSLESAVKSTEVPGLFVLPSGPVPPNPAELLHTARFKEIAQKLGEQYDRVLFDSPPVGAVTDPLVLANAMDGTLLVLKMFRTNRDMAERAIKSLLDANARILGAVLNDVDTERREYGYYLGYYYSYGRYYGQGKERA